MLKNKLKVVFLVLTYNEEKHIERCISSIKGANAKILIVDSFSNDSTVEIAKKNKNVEILQNNWSTHANQINWALTHIDSDTDWVIRIDADEIMSDELIFEITNSLQNLSKEIKGVYLKRSIMFKGRLLKFGGIAKIPVLRIFRYGFGKCENRRTDEHIVINGSTTSFKGDLIDNNLNSLSYWISKHNKYSSNEAIEFILDQHNQNRSKDFGMFSLSMGPHSKRWIKEKVYNRLPISLRAFMYFIYRYIFLLGFLDGRKGFLFHFLQGFWYRFIVDQKIKELDDYMKSNNVDISSAALQCFNIDVND